MSYPLFLPFPPPTFFLITYTFPAMSNSTNHQHSFNDFLDNILVDFPSQNPTVSSPGSYNSNKNTNTTSSSGSDGDERRQKRLMSNRESARRSRKKKQKHLENLTNQVARYGSVNQELMKRLRFVNHNGQMVLKENERLRLESVWLQQKLYSLRQRLQANSLLTSACPCNNNVTANNNNDQNQSTLITF